MVRPRAQPGGGGMSSAGRRDERQPGGGPNRTGCTAGAATRRGCGREWKSGDGYRDGGTRWVDAAGRGEAAVRAQAPAATAAARPDAERRRGRPPTGGQRLRHGGQWLRHGGQRRRYGDERLRHGERRLWYAQQRLWHAAQRPLYGGGPRRSAAAGARRGGGRRVARRGGGRGRRRRWATPSGRACPHPPSPPPPSHHGGSPAHGAAAHGSGDADGGAPAAADDRACKEPRPAGPATAATAAPQRRRRYCSVAARRWWGGGGWRRRPPAGRVWGKMEFERGCPRRGRDQEGSRRVKTATARASRAARPVKTPATCSTPRDNSHIADWRDPRASTLPEPRQRPLASINLLMTTRPGRGATWESSTRSHRPPPSPPVYEATWCPCAPRAESTPAAHLLDVPTTSLPAGGPPGRSTKPKTKLRWPPVTAPLRPWWQGRVTRAPHWACWRVGWWRGRAAAARDRRPDIVHGGRRDGGGRPCRAPPRCAPASRRGPGGAGATHRSAEQHTQPAPPFGRFQPCRRARRSPIE